MATSTPTIRKGLTPYRRKNGQPFNGGVTRFLVSNGYGTALAKGDPVLVSNGFVKVGVNTTNGATAVFQGCKYIDANGQPVESTYFPANTSSGGLLEDETHVLAYVTWDDELTYLAIADGSVSAGQLGLTFPVSVGTPDSITKRSVARVHASANASVGGSMVQVVGFPNIAGTRPDDAATVVEVVLANSPDIYAS